MGSAMGRKEKLRRCGACNEQKPLANFGWRYRKDGSRARKSTCHACNAATSRKIYRGVQDCERNRINLEWITKPIRGTDAGF